MFMMRLKGNFKCAYRPSHTQHHALSINTCVVWTTSITMSVCLQVPVWLLTCKCTNCSKQAGIESGLSIPASREGGCSGMDMLVSHCLSSCLSAHRSVDIFMYSCLFCQTSTSYWPQSFHFYTPCTTKLCVCGYIGFTPSVRLSVCASHMPCLLYGLLPTFISATDQCMHHRCLL